MVQAGSWKEGDHGGKEEEQILPRLREARGGEIVTRVKRFHSFGIGESRADRMLGELEQKLENSGVKLGFQSHFPQLETKLTIHGIDGEDLDAQLAPLADDVRSRLGNFIVAEDDESLENNVLKAIAMREMGHV